MKLKFQYQSPLYIHGIYQVYSASQNIHGIHMVYTYYIPHRGSRWGYPTVGPTRHNAEPGIRVRMCSALDRPAGRIAPAAARRAVRPGAKLMVSNPFQKPIENDV